jgi:hypothetical protein
MKSTFVAIMMLALTVGMAIGFMIGQAAKCP